MHYYGFESETSTTSRFLKVSSERLSNVNKHAEEVSDWQRAKRNYYLARLAELEDDKPEDNFDAILQGLTSKSNDPNRSAHIWLNRLMAYDFTDIIDLRDHFLKVMLALSNYVKWLPMGSANPAMSCRRAIINGLCDTALYIVAMQFLLKPRVWNEDDVKTMHFAATAIRDLYKSVDTFSHLVFGPQLLLVACEMLCHFPTKEHTFDEQFFAFLQVAGYIGPIAAAASQTAYAAATSNVGMAFTAVGGVFTAARDMVKAMVDSDSADAPKFVKPNATMKKQMSVLSFAICGAWPTSTGQKSQHKPDYLLQRYIDILVKRDDSNDASVNAAANTAKAANAAHTSNGKDDEDGKNEGDESTRLHAIIQTMGYMKVFEVIARTIRRNSNVCEDTKTLLQTLCKTAIAHCENKESEAKWAAVRVARIAKARLGEHEFPFAAFEGVDPDFALKAEAYWCDMNKHVSAAQSPVTDEPPAPVKRPAAARPQPKPEQGIFGRIVSLIGFGGAASASGTSATTVDAPGDSTESGPRNRPSSFDNPPNRTELVYASVPDGSDAAEEDAIATTGLNSFEFNRDNSTDESKAKNGSNEKFASAE